MSIPRNNDALGIILKHKTTGTTVQITSPIGKWNAMNEEGYTVKVQGEEKEMILLAKNLGSWEQQTQGGEAA